MNKKIVITGASSEIGMAIVSKLENLASEFTLQTTTNRQDFVDFVASLDKTCRVIKSDFTKSEEISEFCNEIKECDILINAAAVTKTDLLPMLSDTSISNMINVNINALIQICRNGIPYMSSTRKGWIVNISSIAAGRGNRGQSVYAGTKGFTESFSRSLAAEYGSRGVRVNCVAPGAIDAGSLKEIMKYAPDEIKNNMLSKRLGQASDVANLVHFLCSEESEFINGQIIKTDGGFLKGL